ncbi:MAG: ornithine cyclodeaminase family protein, partial [Dehalococcoidales bacterium]|nr:ornithine cyclodeaminase family protein [Dehalococcoidales bacterium]
FKEMAAGKAKMPGKSYVSLEKGDFRAMPAALSGASGVKWVNVHPANWQLNLPTVMAVLIYSDPDTGYPLAIMDASEITAYRTGAASAIASRCLARPGADSLGLIGAGRQAHTQLQAHLELFNLKKIRVYDIDAKRAQAFAQSYSSLPICTSSIEEACNSAIICTTTPATRPVVRIDWIKKGTHINAIGADAPGKQELETEILKNARLVVDDIEQAAKSGEINVPIKDGHFSPDNIIATLGDCITGRASCRINENDITVFDSTGIAIEDIAVARAIYNMAINKTRNRYLEVDFLS